MYTMKILFAAAAILLLVCPVLAGTEKPALQKMDIETINHLNPIHHSPADRSLFEGFEAGVFDPTWVIAGISTEKPWSISGTTGHGSIEGSEAAYVRWDATQPSNETLSFDYALTAGDDQLSFHMAGSVGAVWSENVTETVEVTHAGGTDIVFDFDLAGATNNTWERWDIDLSMYDGETVTITFRYEGVDGDLQAIDAVQIDDGTGWYPDLPEPPENDTCETAIELPHGAFLITGDTSLAINDYDAGSGGCTGYASVGNDVVYIVRMVPWSIFKVTMNAEFDDSIYLVTDCDDVAGTCVAGADEYPSGSTITLENWEYDFQTLYLIVDGYGTSGNGPFEISGYLYSGCPAENTVWGSLKSMYR